MKHTNKFLKWLAVLTTAFLIVTAFTLAYATSAQAETIITGDPNAIVPAGQVIDDDLFITGQLVQIDGTVNGDVFATGQQVVVNGTVAGNLFTAGQVLEGNGNIDGSVYAAGYSLALGATANVSGSIYMAGFSFEAATGSVVGRSVYNAGYQAVLNGEVGRDVLFSGGAFRLNGHVGRNLTVDISETEESDSEVPEFIPFMPGGVEMIGPGYVLGDSATVDGEINYRVIPHQDVSVEVPSRPLGTLTAANWLRVRLGEFVSLLIVGGLLIAIWPNQFKRVEATIWQRPLQSLGWGGLLIFLVPAALLFAILVLILLVVFGGLITLGELAGSIATFGALFIGIAAALFAFVVGLASKAVFGHLLGEKIFDRVSPKALDGRWGALLALLVGVLIYEVVRGIPLLGALLALIVVLVGLGAVATVLWTRNAKPRTIKRAARKARRK